MSDIEKNNALISIIVPVYNGDKYIERCIISLLNQQYANREIIIIDDGSTDNTYKICKKYNDLSEIKLFHIDNHGVSFARNFGLEQANGKYILFVDSDDYVDKNYCNVLMENLISSDADLVVCGFNLYCEGEIKRVVVPSKGKYTRNDFVNEFITTEIVNTPWGKIYKREEIKKTFNVAKNMGEDFEFNMDYIGSISSVICIDEALYNYDISNESSLTKNIAKLEKSIYENARVLRDALKVDNRILQKFVTRRVKDYILTIDEKSNSMNEYREFVNLAVNDEKLQGLVKSVDVFDVQVFLLMHGDYYLLKIARIIFNFLNKIVK